MVEKPKTVDEYVKYVENNGQTSSTITKPTTINTEPPAFTPPAVVEKPKTVDEYVKYVENNGQTSSTVTKPTFSEQKYNNSNSTSATQSSPVYENPTTDMTHSSRVTPSETTPTEKLTVPTRVTPTSTTSAQDGDKKVSHVVRVSQSNQNAYKISEEAMQQRGELKTPIYDPYGNEEDVEYIGASQANNPYGLLLSKQENKRVKQLDKKRDKHRNIAQKADKKARQIKQNENDDKPLGDGRAFGAQPLKLLNEIIFRK